MEAQEKPLPKHSKTWVAALTVGVAGMVTALLFSLAFFMAKPPVSTKLSAATQDPCAASQKFVCYSRYFQKVTTNESPTKAFNAMRTLSANSTFVRSQCHQLSHNVGHAAFKKYGTLAKAYTMGDNYCWSGYYHGVTESAVGSMTKAQIRSQINGICAELAARARYSADHFTCSHGLGHGLFSVENDDLFVALKSCDILVDGWERTSCYGGVYMENIMIPLREAGTTPYLKPTDLMYPCNAVDVPYKGQCYGMQTSYALQQTGYDFAKVAKLCQDLTDVAFVPACYNSLGRDASGSTNSKAAPTKAICEKAIDHEGQRNCMLGAMRDFVGNYHGNGEAKAFCALYESDLRTSCFNGVVQAMIPFNKKS